MIYRILQSILLLFALWHSAKFAFAEEARDAPTAFVRTTGGFTTVKSEMVGSNEVANFFGYTLGFHAGEERDIGVLFASETTTVSYELNDASTATTWNDTILRYRWGGAYLGLMLATASMTAEAASSTELAAAAESADFEELELSGSGYGVNTGFILNINKVNNWYLDVSSVSISSSVEANQIDAAFGSRLDIDTGVLFYLSREAWDLRFGYKMRNYTMSVEGKTFAEAQTQTYLALQLNAFF